MPSYRRASMRGEKEQRIGGRGIRLGGNGKDWRKKKKETGFCNKKTKIAFNEHKKQTGESSRRR